MPKFNYSTREQLNTILREKYKTTKNVANIAEYFISRPIAEIQSAFSVSSAVAGQIRTRMTNINNRRNAAKNDKGE